MANKSKTNKDNTRQHKTIRVQQIQAKTRHYKTTQDNSKTKARRRQDTTRQDKRGKARQPNTIQDKATTTQYKTRTRTRHEKTKQYQKQGHSITTHDNTNPRQDKTNQANTITIQQQGNTRHD